MLLVEVICCNVSLPSALSSNSRRIWSMTLEHDPIFKNIIPYDIMILYNQETFYRKVRITLLQKELNKKQNNLAIDNKGQV